MASLVKTDKIVATAGGAQEFTLPTADGTAKSAVITDGSGVLSFATGTPSSSNFLRGDGTWASAGGDNTPYWHVYLSADQSISNVTFTKVQFNTEVLDSDSEYDNSTNYRYTIVTAGRYYIYSTILVSNDAANWDRIRGSIYKNGSAVTGVATIPGGWYVDTNVNSNQVIAWVNVHAVIDLSAADYLEVFGYVGAYGTAGCKFDAESTFGGYKLV